MKHRKTLLGLLFAVVTLVIMVVLFWLYRLDQNIAQRFAQKRFAPPVEFYSAPEAVQIGVRYPARFFENLFSRHHFRSRNYGQPLLAQDVSFWAQNECIGLSSVALAEDTWRCVVFRPAEHGPTHLIALDETDKVVGLYAALESQPFAAVDTVNLPAELFAQYYGESPTLRQVVPLGETPVHCLNALLAIEDAHFLEHAGVSLTGLGRAFLTNLRAGRFSQGGSTLTQQLVKNYFLTDERTLKRKITEAAMAILVETRTNKDDILETYINLIYMGQNGPFQVRGFASASEHYFGKNLASLDLPQCALLAALVNSPGLFNPFTKPENALKRRTKVLDRMLELKMISENEAQLAKTQPLPSRPQRVLTEPAPYFVQAVRKKINEMSLDESEGLRIYTTLNLRAQEAAHKAVREGLDRLETAHPFIKKLKAKGHNLEAVLLSANPHTGHVEAIVGGRGFLVSQFNRAIDSHRQVGSIMKPFVYLAALETRTPQNEPYTPLTLIKDEAFTHKYQGQSWSPKNYDGEFLGEVPLYYALAESLNAATARLGLDIGLENVVEIAQRLGITSKIDPFPSLTLGAFELYPWEVLQAYNTFATLGTLQPLTYLLRVEDLEGQILYAYEAEAQTAIAPDIAAELVSMLKQTVISGTARSIPKLGFTHPAAGKTGTTNDKKDAWFAGFTPHHTALVWVGYDDNTPSNLTGASGAVPIWTQYMRAYASSFAEDDFPWPATTEARILTPDQLEALGVKAHKNEDLLPANLIFAKEQ